SMLEVFNMSNTELGDAIAVYGITAMLSYFPSGILADRFSARKLMSFSLLATALGGIWLFLFPSLKILPFLYGYWGITTILLFWSAMIKATREWGGELAQGRAFGLLDGGRGLVAAGVASLGVVILGAFFKEETGNINLVDRARGFQTVVLFYSLLTIGASLLIWFTIPDTPPERLNPNPLKGIPEVLKRASTWLIALVVITAYCGFKALDFYGLYLMQITNSNEVEAARFVANASYLRPVAAIAAGFVADRFTTRKTILVLFSTLVPVYFVLGVLVPGEDILFIVLMLLFTFAAVYALRGVYFASLEESNVPKNITGATVGVVSLLGFTPDVFFNSVAGRIIENSGGIEGFYNFYLLLSNIAITGLIAAFLLSVKKPN
ncbi:MAG TPA: MFS transporter, partial [Prolixibacteraceae bacterium]|nr:MFS transporter [Prolixibacteraceae bacterium]